MNALDHLVVSVPINDDETIGTKSDHQEKTKRRRYSCFQWIELIAAICIPLIIGLYTILDGTNNISIAIANRQKDMEIAELNRQKDHDLAKDQQLENILNDYQTFLGKLILDVGKNLSQSTEAKRVARFKTLTALQQLDTKRVNILIRSLYDAELITLRKTGKSNDERSVLDLRRLHLKDLTLGSPRNSPRSYPDSQRIEWHYLWLPQNVFTNVSFRHVYFLCVDFSFTHMDLVDLEFTVPVPKGRCIDYYNNATIDFRSTRLTNTTLYRSTWAYADFNGASLISVDMSMMLCTECGFRRTNLSQVNLSGSQFNLYPRTGSRSDFQQIEMNQVIAHSTTFFSIDFEQSIWNNVQASAIKIIDCLFRGAKIKNSSWIKGIFEKSAFQNAKLDAIDLSYAKLYYVSFTNSTIRSVNLSFIICNNCTFTNVTFENITWTNASLRNSYFRHCHLNLSQLIENAIDLSGTSLSNETNELILGTEEQHLKKIDYYIRVKTSEDFQAGTDGDIYLKIVAKNMDIDQIQLRSTDHQIDSFESGRIDRFRFEFFDLGSITQIIIELSGNNYADGWRLDWIEIEIPIHDEVYKFDCDCWLDKSGTNRRALRPIPMIKKTNVILYEINVFTGSDFGAGTNANVYIIIYGEYNNTGRLPLIVSKSWKDPFENDQIDVFEVEAINIIKPIKIKIGHDNSGSGPDWLLERVDIYIPKLGQTWRFLCGKWSSKFQNEFELEVKSFSNT